MTPNLFIVGAPKCGTSSLFDWLANHPDIRGSQTKEPFLLIDPSHPLARKPNVAIDGLDAYRNFYAPEDKDARFRMEATTHYLFDPFARAKIAEIPESRVIVVIREPAARVYSSFRFTANNLARIRSDLTFTKFVELVKSGRPLMPVWCTHHGSAYVLERDIAYSRYVNYLIPWMEALGPGRLRVVVMEEMVRDPSSTIATLLDWLGLDQAIQGPVHRRPRNRTESVRFPSLQSSARKLNSRVRLPAWAKALLMFGYASFQFRSPRPIEDDDARALVQLRKSFVEDNARLAMLTGVDLASWDEAYLAGGRTA